MAWSLGLIYRVNLTWRLCIWGLGLGFSLGLQSRGLQGRGPGFRGLGFGALGLRGFGVLGCGFRGSRAWAVGLESLV